MDPARKRQQIMDETMRLKQLEEAKQMQYMESLKKEWSRLTEAIEKVDQHIEHETEKGKLIELKRKRLKYSKEKLEVDEDLLDEEANEVDAACRLTQEQEKRENEAKEAAKKEAEKEEKRRKQQQEDEKCAKSIVPKLVEHLKIELSIIHKALPIQITLPSDIIVPKNRPEYTGDTILIAIQLSLDELNELNKGSTAAYKLTKYVARREDPTPWAYACEMPRDGIPSYRPKHMLSAYIELDIVERS
jgi:hypothetical protein